MQRVADEVKEFFVPTARCFKGFSILLAIWGCASLLICGLVPSIILVHNPLPKSQYGGDFGEGQKGGVDPIVAAYQQKSSMFGDSNFHNRYANFPSTYP